MEILEYDQVDGLGVFHLNLLALNYPLTPERMARIELADPRPFPFWGVYAVVDGIVAGQVGVYRLPMVTVEGPEDVGGICAVATHPAFGRQGIAARLMDEAHARMREAGLRFSTLGTSAHRVAHGLYRRTGYTDVVRTASALAGREIALRSECGLRAERAGESRLPDAERLFEEVAAGRVGFARRHPGHLVMLAATGDLDVGAVWLVWDGDELAGYAIASLTDIVLDVTDCLHIEGITIDGLVAALVNATDAPYVRVRVYRPMDMERLTRLGYSLAQPDWTTFMLRPLVADVTIDAARRLFCIGTDRFMMSWMDIT